MVIDKAVDEPSIVFRLDPGSGVPTYQQIVRQVEHALRLGYLVPGDRLPTVKDVVAALAINPNTVLKAYRELELVGLVEARQGAGTFVAATLGGSASPESLARLHNGLTKWVRDAHAAGLENEDIEALLRVVLTNTPLSGNGSGPNTKGEESG